jgi:hypothetical protein
MLFVSPNFWIFVLGAASLLLFTRRERNPFALYLFLLCAVPPFAAALPGFGIVNKLFELNFPRLLALLVLLPFVLRPREPGTPGFGKVGTDWLVVAYLLLQMVLQYRAESFTHTLRTGFNEFLDVFLPYFAASRALHNSRDVRDILLSFVAGTLVLVPIAVFESARHWLLYSAVSDSLGVTWGGGSYLGRAGALRAMATAGHSIVLGYVMAIALLLHFGLRQGNPMPKAWMAGLAALVIGLVATVSRGPWVGAAAGILAMTLASRQPGRRVARLIVPALVGGVALMISPWGDKVLAYLPFIGTIDTGNVSYRQQLFEISMKVIAMEPWFGSPYFMYTEQMQQLRIGNLIDVVNTYLLVALRYGYVGLAVFCAAPLAALWSVVVALRRQTREDTERFGQGQAMLGMLIAVLVTLATSSDTSFIPMLFWSVTGLAIAYGRLVASEVEPEGVARRHFALGSS